MSDVLGILAVARMRVASVQATRSLRHHIALAVGLQKKLRRVDAIFSSLYATNLQGRCEMKTTVRATLLAILIASSSHAEQGPDDSVGVVLWRGFHTAMTPAMVAEEINKTGLDDKGDVVVANMPKKPKYQRIGANPIPVIYRGRLSRYTIDTPLELSGHTLSGPSFAFDDQDKLAEVYFRYAGNGSFMPVKIGCTNLRESIAESGLEFLTGALQNKYELLNSAKDIRVFSDGSTRVWLTYEAKFEKSLDSAMYKCNERTARLTLHYGDQRRISELIEGIFDDRAQEAADVL